MVASLERQRSGYSQVISAAPGGRSLRVPVALISAGAAFGDFAMITAYAWLTGLAYHWQVFSNQGAFEYYIATGSVFASLFVLRMHARSHYSMEKIASNTAEFLNIISSWCLVAAILAGLAFVFQIGDDISRGFVLIFVATGPLVLIGTRFGYKRLARYAIDERIVRERRVLLIGEHAETKSISLHRRLRSSGYSVADVIVCDLANPDDVAACADSAVHCVRAGPIDEILVCISWSRFGEITDILTRLRILPLPVLVVADRRMRNLLANPVANIGSMLALEVQRGPLSLEEQTAKRVLDILFVGMALLPLLPLLALVALAVRLDSPGPVLFCQMRAGFSGRRFRIYKFRTMTVLEDGAVVKQATRDDARITRVGRFLRSTSIDELPQLINVLLGEMSLVGPRPHALAHDDQYTRVIGNYAYRHHVKPGITGLAQVSGYRGETETIDKMERRIDCDIQYINNWSIWLDLKIIFLTSIQVFKRDAY